MQVCFMDVCEKGREEITELLLSRSGMTGRAQEEEVLIIPAELYVNSREKCCHSNQNNTFTFNLLHFKKH